MSLYIYIFVFANPGLRHSKSEKKIIRYFGICFIQSYNYKIPRIITNMYAMQIRNIFTSFQNLLTIVIST